MLSATITFEHYVRGRHDTGNFKQRYDYECGEFGRTCQRTPYGVPLGTTIDGVFSADSLKVGGALFMRSTDENKAEFKEVLLRSSRVAGNVELVGAKFDGILNLDGLQTGASLFLRSEDKNKANFKEVVLRNAKVAANVEVIGATFDGKFEADGMRVGGALFMRDNATFKAVKLIAAKIVDEVDMDGATFDGDLDADHLEVGGSLFMRSTGENKAKYKNVVLRGVKVAGSVEMTDATFYGDLNADSLRVGSHLFMLGTIGKGKVNMVFVHTGGNLDLRGATLAALDLSGGAIGGDLRLGGDGSPVVWRTDEDKPGKLSLRNTRIANLMDAKDAWPISDHLDIDGFAFTHLGGFGGETGPDMRGRGMQWWDDWIRRDLKFTPAPYEQLATAFVAAGDRAAADEIRYLGRVRQREVEVGWWPRTFAGFLQYVAGFGIGDYTFRVLYWVTGISVAGALYLWACVPRAKANGAIWCFGASLSRLLPVIEINKEFSDFFNDPKRRRLSGTQTFIFSAIGMVGWVLGAILVAAVAGLTQKV